MTWLSVDAAVRNFALPAAGGILLNQLDELFMDANYLLRGLHRRERRIIPWRALERVPQKRIAILVPAWREADVICQMLEHNLACIDHDRSRYSIFCGTYVNDPETQREVDAAARRFPNVRKVVVPHDGPTSKADCLNWIYQGVLLDEQRRGCRYDILLMHDAEDVIHPLSLRLYSLLIPRYDFVQTPVFSLELGLGQAVAATYIDEFAEHHLKDMLVREALGGLIPSAGVGSAFHRESFAQIARAHGERPFNVESLTEDYEIGLKFRLAGKRVHFACHAIESTSGKSADAAAGMRRPPKREEMIATREYFPGGFRASVRQRSRWILGISLQTWRQIGWQGSLPVLYCLWRDRKALFTNALVCLAYLIVAYGVVRATAAAVGLAPPSIGAQGWAGHTLAVLLAVNLVALLWRVGLKAKLVGRLYGFGHAVLSAPRMILGNLIGLAATARALGMFVKHRVTGKPLRWLKTAHAFPSVDVLRAQRRRLGEILRDEQALTSNELEDALTAQQQLGRPLGEVLSLMGIVSERTVARALARLHDLADVDPLVDLPHEQALTALGEVEAERLGVVPLASLAQHGVRIAAAAPLDVEAIRALEERFRSQVHVVLASPAAVRQSRQEAYRRLISGASDVPQEAPAPPRLQPEDVDRQAVLEIGRGFCAVHAVLPLLPDNSVIRTHPSERRLACAFPLHPQVLASIVDRLASPVTVVRAALLDLDVALALLPGPEGSLEPGDPPRDHTLGLLEQLESVRDGDGDAMAAALTRGKLLGLPVTRSAAGPIQWSVLPTELQGPDAIFIRGLAERALILATARPNPRLSRAVAALYHGWAIAWQVELPNPENLTKEEEEELPWTTRAPQTFPAMNN